MTKIKIVNNLPGYCPYCGSTNIDLESHSYYDDCFEQYYICLNCKRDFIENYELVYISKEVYDGDYPCIATVGEEVDYYKP